MKKMFLLLIGTLLAGCSSHSYLVTQQWHEVESDHFRVLTNAQPDKVEDLTRELERFRITTSHLLGLSLEHEDKLTIIALRDRLGYQGMVGAEAARKTAGYFSDNLYGRHALLNLNGYSHLKNFHDNWSRQLLYHEYTHYLVARGSRAFTYPFWFQEGFAEFLSTAVCDEVGECVYGHIPVDRALTLQHHGFMALDRLLTATRAESSGTQTLQVYASGWLLTHMLMTSRDGRQRLQEYLAAVHAGRDPVQAHEDISGAPLAQLQKEYRQYGRGKMTAISLCMTQGYGDNRIRTRPVDTATALSELGKALALKGEQQALQQLQSYAQREGIDTQPLQYSVQFAALQAARKQGPETADTPVPVADLFAPGFDQGWESGVSDDHWPRLVYAETLVHQAQQQPQQRDELLRQAYYLYKSIVERDGRVAAAWYGLGVTSAQSQVPATTYQKYFWMAWDLSLQSEPAALALLQALTEAQMRDEFVRYGKVIVPMVSDPEVRKRLAAAVEAAEHQRALVLPPSLAR